jgi:hypothetical protein
VHDPPICELIQRDPYVLSNQRSTVLALQGQMNCPFNSTGDHVLVSDDCWDVLFAILQESIEKAGAGGFTSATQPARDADCAVAQGFRRRQLVARFHFFHLHSVLDSQFNAGCHSRLSAD